MTKDNKEGLRGYVQEKILNVIKMAEEMALYDVVSLISQSVKCPEEVGNLDGGFDISENVNLNNTERMVILQKLKSITLEIEEKRHGLQAIDYGSIKVISQLIFQIAYTGLENKKIHHITYKVAYDDNLVEYSVKYQTSLEQYNIKHQEFILTIWDAESDSYNKYNTYKTELKNFEEESLRLLMSSYELIQFYNEKEEAREFISYTTVAMNYLLVLEKEIKKLILLRSGEKLKVKNLVDAINHLQEFDQYDVFTEKLIERLHQLRTLRNRAAHGEHITRIQCEEIITILFENHVFEYLSWNMEDNPGKGLPEDKGPTLIIGEENGKLKVRFDSYFKWTEESDMIKRLHILAESGDVQAQFELGRRYFKGEDIDKDWNEAVKWLEKAAINNHIEAQLYMGEQYLFGFAVKEDYKKAYKWMKLSAEGGNMDAQFQLGNMYQSGNGVRKNIEEAYKWYTLAAQKGDIEAQYRRAVMQMNGDGTSQNFEEVINWAKQAAQKNNAKAQCLLGLIYHDGKGVEKDNEQAIKWYKVAAENGDADAQYVLGKTYELGIGTRVVYTRAFQYYKMAAEQNLLEAVIKIAELYYSGKGIEANISEALSWINIAVEANSEKAKKIRQDMLSYEYVYEAL